MKILDGKILPGESIGKYKLGANLECILRSLDSEYMKQEREDGSCVVDIENAKFWFDKYRNLFQIGVTKGFREKYDGKIGIGDTLDDVQKNVGPFFEEGDDYLIKNVKGIALDLADDDDWNELTTPIEWIYVYKP